MELRMIRYGLYGGLGFLFAVALLEWWARPGAGDVSPRAADGHITDQVWAVLAEARRITEESA